MAHHHRHKREAKPEPLKTIVSVVYHTLSPTFSGPIAGYSTQDGHDHTTTDAASQELKTTTYEVLATLDGQTVSWENTATITVGGVLNDASTTAKKSGTTSIVSTATVTPTPSTTSILVDTSAIVMNPSTTLAKSVTSVLVASGTLHSTTSATNAAESASASATADATSSSKGLSGGAVAGIIIGVLAVLALGVGVFWVVARNKKRKEGQEFNEKEDYPRNDILAAPTRSNTSAAAPQLHVRPVTQFSPNFGGNAESGGPWGMSEKTGDNAAYNKNMGAELSKANPFGTHAAAASNEQDEANPFGNHAVTPEGTNTVEGAAIGAAVGTAVGGAAGARDPRRSSLDAALEAELAKENNGAPNPSDGMSIDTGAIALLPGPGKKPAPVHRVQMEYKQQLQDEITVHPGVLVRLISAYDDGWCYVIRLDGGAKGVCPRSCLSVHPIKPRSRGPGQQGRPMTPQGQGRPMTPQGRPMTPQGPMGNSPARPMTPGQARPMTPSSGGHPSPMYRPQSPAMNRGPRPQSPAMNQGRPSSPAMMQQAPRPMTPTTGTSKALPMSPGTSSGGANAGSSPRGPGSSRLNESTSSEAGSEEQAFSASEESSSVLASSSPAKSPPKSQIPLPVALTTPVGRKPVPGQAL